MKQRPITEEDWERLQGSWGRMYWRSNPIDSLSIKINGNCPVQGFGNIGCADGEHELYFRARWSSWRLEITDQEVASGDYGDDNQFDAGWMPVADALRMIADGLDAYRDKALQIAEDTYPQEKEAK